ncbi:M13 family metallopeptidase [Halioxenophilus sp. WMMB6]|uniref:M13 family metallopeptidase n=1 Tax=Halioxenophilus sp. WMMB6 TaxID=3073815 RepID=UPI00295ECCEF|nr:M13-type metalloendopeptidase [Halioxenophilus sp. WMMB6]
MKLIAFKRLRAGLIMAAATTTLLAACDDTGTVIPGTKLSNAPVSGLTDDHFDHSLRPQDDLYDFVNGAWLGSLEIPPDRSSYGSFIHLRDESEKSVKELMEELLASDKPVSPEIEKVKILYQTFMDEAAIAKAGSAPYQAIAEQIDQIDNRQALFDFMAQPWMQTGLAPMALFVDADKKNPDQYTVYLYQTGLSLPDRDYYFDESDKGQEILAAFKQHLANMLTLVDDSAPEASAATIFELESKLAEGQWPRVEMRDAAKTYNPATPSAMASSYANIDWNTFLSAGQVAEQGEIILGQPSYLAHLNELFATVPLADWKTYLKWRSLTYLAPYLNQELETEDYNFYSATLYGTKEQRARWKRGIGFASGIAGEAIGKLYVERHFPPAAKERMVTLVENLREAYRQSIQGLDWMTEETKAQAIIKLDKFIPKIGYPDVWKDYSALVVTNNSLVANVLAGANFEYQQQIDKLGKPIDRNEWFMTPQTVNAYYNPLMNEIVFPAAILQPPFFNLDADDAVNYGAIGGVIGHEMGHGFDDQGSRYNGDGKLDDWWQAADSEAFAARTGALVKQYGQFEALPDLFVNGQLTLGENIGDLGGLTIAYKAYQLSLNGLPAPAIDGFSGEQRFFFGWAQAFASKYTDENLRNRVKTDPHSPAQFRVNGVVRNMPEFVAAFGVKEGDKLYLPPEERVKIW